MFIGQLVPSSDLLRRIKIKVFGSSGSGKSTLIDSMKCSYLNSFFRRSRLGNKTVSTKKKLYGKNRNQLERIGDDLTGSFDSASVNQAQVTHKETRDNQSVAKREIMHVQNILDNYETVNAQYTKGIEISQCTFSGSHHFSIWEFSGYEPYQIFYDTFVSQDSFNCVNMIVYDLNQTSIECYEECVHWLEYLRARTTTLTKNQRMHQKAKILFVATHADLLDQMSSKKNENGACLANDKADQVRLKLGKLYENDHVFDLSERHFVLDSRAAWLSDIKNLIDYLIKFKQSLCEKLPRCTTFLNRSLNLVHAWRKQPTNVINNTSLSQSNGKSNSNSPRNSISTSSSDSTPAASVPSTPTTHLNNAFVYFQQNNTAQNVAQSLCPILSYKQFVDRIREQINPLASEEHLNELLGQLSLMGEVVFLPTKNGNEYSDEMQICFQPEWLCGKVLGRLFAHERYMQLRPANLNGFYTLAELKELYSDLCSNMDMLVKIFTAFDLCTELEKIHTLSTSSSRRSFTQSFVYEFPAFNFLSEPMPLAFHNVKTAFQHNKSKSASCFVFNGFRLHASNFHLESERTNLANLASQLPSVFFKIQANLRHLSTNNSNCYFDIDDNVLVNNMKKSKETQGNNDHSTPVKNVQSHSEPLITPLVLLRSPNTKSIYVSSSDTANTTSSTSLPTPSLSSPNSIQNYFTEPSSNYSFGVNNFHGALIDIELYQTRYCTRLKRKSCSIECLISLEHRNGEFIEIRACAPDKFREELFYFVQDLYILIERVVFESCPNLNLEKHYLNFDPLHLNNKVSDNQGSVHLGVIEHESIYSPREIVKHQFESSGKNLQLIDLICCGSELIEKNLTYGIDLPLSELNPYTKEILCSSLNRADPMGRDWSILGCLLGLHEYLPQLDEACSLNPSSSNKCEFLLNEWCRQCPEQATVRNLLLKIRDLGRTDVHDMIAQTIDLFKLNLSKDSGIQNSNQTLASLR